jgi:DNA-binding MarR family transcriptional regulator
MNTTTTFIHDFITTLRTLTGCSNETERLLDRWLTAGGYPNVMQLLTLKAIHDGINYPTELTKELGQPAPSVSQYAKALTQQQLITIERDITDGRRRKITITTQGTQTLNAALQHLENEMTRSRITTDTINPTRLTNAIDKLRKRIVPHLE